MKQPQHVKNPVTPQWATEINGRHPKFKIHAKLAHAKNAVSYRNPSRWSSGRVVLWMRQDTEPTPQQAREHAEQQLAADLYEWVDGQWVHHPEWSFSMDDYVFEKAEAQHHRQTYWVVTFRQKGN